MACAKSLEHFKELTGKENQDYLKANFNKMWDEHDIHNDKQIDVTEAYTLLRDI